MSTPITIPVNFDFSPGFSSAPRAAAELQRLFNRTNSLNAFSSPLGNISKSTDEFANSLKAANARLFAFGASAVVLVGVQKALEGLFTSTINVEKKLTDINVVLNESSTGLKRFGSELFSVARLTGQSFDTVSDAALELSRQGLSVEETLKRTKDALILTRLSGLSAADSVNALTAGINSFNKTLISSTELINKFAAVDARFAVSSADLAEALKRVGSTAEDAGVSLDELLALVTSVQQTTARGGAVIGNAFKNIFSRLSRSSTIEDLKNLGVEIDASQSGVEKLQALANAYNKVGAAQAAQIKEAAGGIYQINIVSAALDQLSKKYGSYQQALKASSDAADEAAVRNELLNQTLSSLINRTQVNFTKLFSDIGSLSIDTPLRNVLNGINSALESASDQEDGGGKLAESFLKGIGRFIEGPGLIYLGTIGISLTRKLAEFSGNAFKQLNNLKLGNVEQILNAEKSIQSVLARNPQLQQQIINGNIRIEDLQSRILADLRAELVLRERIAALSQRIAPTILQSGVRFNPNSGAVERRTRASGFIPTGEETVAETMGAYAAGYAPGNIKAANVKGLGRIVYNDAEKVVALPGMAQPAIIPPQNSKVSGVYRSKFKQKFGVDPYSLATGYVPNFKNENNFRMRKGSFGDYEFENRFGGGIVDIFDDEAEIGAIDTKEQGKGTYKLLLSDLMSNLRQKGIKKVKGFLVPQNNKPRTDSLTDQIKANYPQLIRGRYGKSSILTIDGRAIRLAGGEAFDSSLEKQANTILASIRNGEDVDFETFLNKGLVPNFSLSDAIMRESQAVNPLQIKVGRDARLVSAKNPAGLGVYNTKHEPGGLSQGIARAYAEGLDPKTYNVPNYAAKKTVNKTISGGVDPLIVSGTSGGQKFEIIVRIPPLDRAAATFENAAREQKIDRIVKERNDARSIIRQTKIQEEERFLYNAPFRKERRLLREQDLFAQRFQGPPLPPIQVANPYGPIRIPKVIIPKGPQSDTLQDNYNFNYELKREAELIAMREADVEARNRRRLERATNSINAPRIGPIYAPNPNESINVNGGAQYVANQGRVTDPFINRRFSAPPIIGANGRLFIPGVSDFQQTQDRSAYAQSLLSQQRLTEENALRRRASSLLPGRSRAAINELLSKNLINQQDLPNIENARANRLQNFGFGASIAVPILSQVLADQIPQTTRGGRIGGAGVRALGDAGSFAATAFVATGGNPAAAVIGGVIGALNGLVNMAKEAGNSIPELTTKLEKLKEESNLTARSASEYISISQKLTQARTGELSITKGQLRSLEGAQATAFQSLSSELRQQISKALDAGDVRGAFGALDRVQTFNTQSAALIERNIRNQELNKSLPLNFNSSGNSGRNFAELTKLSLDNPLLGGRIPFTSVTGARAAQRLIANNSSIDGVLGRLLDKGLNQGLLDLAGINTVSDSEIKDAIKTRRLLNNEGRKTTTTLGSQINLTGSTSLLEAASKDAAFQETLKGGNFSKIIAGITTVAKKNEFNVNEITSFLEDFSNNASEQQKEAFKEQLKKGFTLEEFTKSLENAQKVQAIQVRNAVKAFEVDRSFNNLFDRLNKNARAFEADSISKGSNLELNQSLSGVALSGRLERSNVFGGDLFRNKNQLTETLNKLRADNIVAQDKATREFSIKSSRSVLDQFKNAVNRVGQNSQQGGSNPEERQNRLNAVKALFEGSQGLNLGSNFANLKNLNSDNAKNLIANITETQNSLISARENKQTFSINGDTLNVQDINDVIGTLDTLLSMLNGNLDDLNSTLTESTQTTNRTVKVEDALSKERARTIVQNARIAVALEKNGLSFDRTTATNAARFDNSLLSSNNSVNIRNLGLVGNQRLAADASLSINNLQAQNRFSLSQTERDIIGQSLKSDTAVGLDLSRNSISSLAGVQNRIQQIGTDLESGDNVEQNKDLLFKYLSIQQRIVEEQNKLNDLLPEQIAREKELLRLKQAELEFNTAFSDEKAKLNYSAIEGRIRQGQGVTARDFASSFGDQLTYTPKDFQRDAITGTAEVANTIKSSFASATADVIKNGRNIKDALTGVLTSVLEKIIDKTSEISTNFLFNGLKAAGGAIAGFSEGGVVSGGSGFKDDVPAKLTKGEYVLKKSAVQKIGLQNLEKLNAGVNINLENDYRYNNELRPTSGNLSVDPNLSIRALTDTEISRSNVNRMDREKALLDYLNELRGYNASKTSALNAYNAQKRNRLYGSLISAGVGVAGAGIGSYFRSSSAAGVKGGVDYRYNASPYNNFQMRAAGGGVMFGGTSASDSVSVKLMGGEGVIKKSVVDAKGVNFFNSLNNGYAEGGLVKPTIVAPQVISTAQQPASNNISNQTTNTVNIAITINSDGKSGVDIKEDNKKKSEQGKALADLINVEVKKVLVKESTAGGMLYNIVRSK